MSTTDPYAIDTSAPPFRHFRSVRRLAPERRGQSSTEHSRHQLYVGVDKRTSTGVLFKVMTKPGKVYEQNIANELESLTIINRELPDSPYFPWVHDSGRLPDGRLYLITSLFDELPLATGIAGRNPGKLVAHLRAAIEVARGLVELHGLQIVHVDLNPMNILYRAERNHPVVRIVDFESSYARARHAAGVFYSPPTTPRFSAPEVSSQAPDARADVYSLGAVLYTLLAGYEWTWDAEAEACIGQDHDLDDALKEILLRAVAPDPRRRYGTMGEFRDALGGYLEAIWPGRSW
jgi:serine/threonine protein kinase